MQIQILLQFIINGLMIGGVYALGAMSLAIIYRTTQIFNFAVGEIMAVGMFTAWSLMVLGLPLWVAIPAGMIVTIALGWAIYRFAIHPLLGQPVIAAIMATFALMFFLQGVMLIVWKGVTSQYPIPLPGENLKIGPIFLSNELVWIFIIALISAALIMIFMQRTMVGLGMRAAAENLTLAQARGVPVSWMFAVTWMLAAAICGVAGIFVAFRLGVDLTISSVGLSAFPAVLLGGLESVPGALLGGMIMGLVISLTSGLVDPSAASIAPFVALLIILLVRPEGLFGLKRIERI